MWNKGGVREWRSVRSQFGKEGENDIVGRLFAIMGEKYAEDGVFLHMHTYRARVVFAGNHMRTASGMQADELFQEFSQTPAAVVF